MKHRYRRRGQSLKAFSLVELLAAITITAILAALLIPLVRHAISLSDVSRCASNLRSLYNATQLYVNDHGRYPNSMSESWHGKLAPYVDVVIHPDSPVPGSPDSENNVFYCPSIDNEPEDQVRRSYAFNSRAGDINGETEDYVTAIENPTQTAMIADAHATSWLMGFGNISLRHHGNSANVIFFDGHLENLAEADLATRTRDVFIDGKAE